jgi:hypothetical protein
MSKGLITGADWYPPKSNSYLARGNVKIGDAFSISVFIKEKNGEKYVSWPGRMVDGKWMSDVFVLEEAREEVNGSVLKLFETEFNGKKASGNGGKRAPVESF